MALASDTELSPDTKPAIGDFEDERSAGTKPAMGGLGDELSLHTKPAMGGLEEGTLGSLAEDSLKKSFGRKPKAESSVEQLGLELKGHDNDQPAESSLYLPSLDKNAARRVGTDDYDFEIGVQTFLQDLKDYESATKPKREGVTAQAYSQIRLFFRSQEEVYCGKEQPR